MGHRDSINPSKMAIEGSSIFTSESSVNDTPHNESVNVSLDESEPADDVTGVQKSSKKRKAEKEQEKSGHKGKRRRRDISESTTQDWQSSFMEMWEKSMEQDNVPRKCSMTPRTGKWNKQTPYSLASKTFLKI